MNNQDAIKRFRQRRSARLGFETIKHYDSVKEYRKRRAERLADRMDADGDEESKPAPKKGGGHGNTKLPFGLCQREEIEIQAGWTPQDAWKALEGKGYSAGEAYKELKETGKVSKKGNGKAAEAETKASPGKKDYSAMDYDTIAKEYEDHERRYQETEEKYRTKDKKIKNIKSTASRVKDMIERGDYHGEKYEDLEKAEDIDPSGLDNDAFVKWYSQRMARKAMDLFGHDVFSKSNDEIDKMSAKMTEELENLSFWELNQEREAIQKAMATKAVEKYKNIGDCDTPMALEARLRGDDFFAPDNLTSTAMAYHSLDPVTVKGVGRALDTIKEKFPEMKGMLQPFLVDDSVADDAYAHCQISLWSNAQVVLSKRRFRDGKGLQEALKNDVKSKYHPRGTDNFESVITHEYAHAIDDHLTKKYKDELGGKSFCMYVLKRLQENHPIEDRTGLMRKVSVYSVNNSSPQGMEFLAEALSEYCSAKKPRPIAMEVGKIVTEFMKNPKSALEPRKTGQGWAPPDDDEEVPLF